MKKVEKRHQVQDSQGRTLEVLEMRRYLEQPASGRDTSTMKPTSEKWYELRDGMRVWRDDEHHFRIIDTGEILETARPKPIGRRRR